MKSVVSDCAVNKKTFKVHIRHYEDTSEYKHVIENIHFIKEALHSDVTVKCFPETTNLLDDIDTARKCDCIITQSSTNTDRLELLLNEFEAFNMSDSQLYKLVEELKLFTNGLSA